MHLYSGSVLSPSLSPPSFECSVRDSRSDRSAETTGRAKVNSLVYPLSPMSNSTPPLPQRSNYATSSIGAARSPSEHYPPSLSILTDSTSRRLSSPMRPTGLLPPLTPSGYRSRSEFVSPPHRLDTQSASLLYSQSPKQQNFSPTQQTPRRAKAHVPSACVNCKNAHLACDVSRPCPRCISTGKQDSCIDVEHKKRGRPRLRDVRHSFEISRVLDSRSGVHPDERPISPPSLYEPKGLRLPGPERTARSSISSRISPYALSDSRHEHHARPIFTEPVSQRSSIDSSSYPPPTAYLTTDLLVASSTGSFQDLLGFAAHDLNLVRTVYDLATDSPTDLKNLDRVLRRINALILQEDPNYRTPLPQDVYNVLQRSSSTDLRSNLQGTPVVEEYFDFRRSDSAVIKGFARFILNRAGVYFVSLEVDVVKGRSYIPSSSRVSDTRNSSHIPHRGSIDSLQNHRPAHRRSFPSPTLSAGSKSVHISPSTSYLPGSMAAPPPGPNGATYPPALVHQHHRNRSVDAKPPTSSYHNLTIPPLRQYSVASHSHTSVGTHGSPTSLTSPSTGAIFASPTAITPRTEAIHLPPLRGISSMQSLTSREFDSRGLGISLSSDKKVVTDERDSELYSGKRDRIGVKEIVE